MMATEQAGHRGPEAGGSAVWPGGDPMRVHWLPRLLLPFPGLDRLARHVPELRTTAGQIAAPLFWYLLTAAGTAACLQADARGRAASVGVQVALVLGAFLLVDVFSLHARDFWDRRLGPDAYRLCFWLLISPGLMGGFLAGQVHLALVRGERLLPRAVSFPLALPLLALGLLLALRVYQSFSLDRLLYMYVFHPGEGALVQEGVYS